VELLAGLIGAVVGFASKAFTDVLTERRRREGEKRAHLLETTLRQAVDFMEAAARLARTRQAVSGAFMALDGAKSSGNEETYQHYRTALKATQDSAASASADAEKAQAAISLLIPQAAGATRSYLDLCNDADAHPDEKRDAREHARQTAEQAIRSAMGL
jgi:hypothetical protein